MLVSLKESSTIVSSFPARHSNNGLNIEPLLDVMNEKILNIIKILSRNQKFLIARNVPKGKPIKQEKNKETKTKECQKKKQCRKINWRKIRQEGIRKRMGLKKGT